MVHNIISDLNFEKETLFNIEKLLKYIPDSHKTEKSFLFLGEHYLKKKELDLSQENF